VKTCRGIDGGLDAFRFQQFQQLDGAVLKQRSPRRA
jgi:hypothetical protein